MNVASQQPDAEHVSIAGTFAVMAIESYINDTRAAASPSMPEQLGGDAYIYFKDVYDDIARALAEEEVPSESLKQQVRERAISEMRAHVDRAEEVGDDELKTYAYLCFSEQVKTIDSLLAGESLAEIKSQRDLRRASSSFSEVPSYPKA